MPSIEHTSNWPNAVTLRGIDLVIFHEWAEREVYGRQLFNVRDSNQYQEDALTVGGIGTFDTKPEGAALNLRALNEGFRTTFTHVDYGNMMRVTREMMRDELYQIMQDLGVELARAARATEETLLANHLNNASSASYTGADGVSLVNSAHVREDGTTYSNTLSSPADLSQTSLEQALIDFSDFRDGGGKRISIEPTQLWVAKENRWDAHRLLRSEKSPEDDTNADNPLQGLLQPFIWNYLTDSDAWFLAADKSDHNLTLYDREAFWTDYEYDFVTKDYMISGMFAQASGWADSRGFFGSIPA